MSQQQQLTDRIAQASGDQPGKKPPARIRGRGTDGQFKPAPPSPAPAPAKRPAKPRRPAR